MIAPASTKRKKRPAKRTTRKHRRHEGPNVGLISPGEVYTLEEAARRLNQGERAVREMFNNGLKRRHQGKRIYIKSDDLIAYLNSLPEVE